MQYTKLYLFFVFNLAYSYGKKEKYNWKFLCENGVAEYNDVEVCHDNHKIRLERYGIDCCNHEVRKLREEFQSSFHKVYAELLDKTTVSVLIKFFNKVVL